MNILYDASPLLMRSAGVKNYHHTLLKNLTKKIHPHRLKLFPDLASLTENRNDGSNYPPWDTRLRLGLIVASNYLKFPYASYLAKGADLFHVTPLPWQIPSKLCLTSMIHDPTPVLLPECHTESNIRYFIHFLEHVVPRLRAILVPSQAVKIDLVRHLGIPEERISVVYHGVEDDFFEAQSSSVYRARQTYGLPNTYILTVGTIEPRKNLLTLVKAYSMLRPGLRKEYPLVIAGMSGWKNRQTEKQLAKVGALVIGHVRRSLMPALYHSASMFVFPSLYEGFGMPILEAMAAQLPIVTSQVSAMPEIAKEGAIYVDTRSPAELSAAMARVLENADLAARHGLAGRRRARTFTWEQTARQTKDFFENALGSMGF